MTLKEASSSPYSSVSLVLHEIKFLRPINCWTINSVELRWKENLLKKNRARRNFRPARSRKSNLLKYLRANRFLKYLLASRFKVYETLCHVASRVDMRNPKINEKWSRPIRVTITSHLGDFILFSASCAETQPGKVLRKHKWTWKILHIMMASVGPKPNWKWTEILNTMGWTSFPIDCVNFFSRFIYLQSSRSSYAP